MLIQIKKTWEFEEMQSGPQTKGKMSRRWSGLAQLSLVEHSLCPLDPGASLVENLVHDAAYFYLDGNRHMQQAKARVNLPAGLSTADEFYLWGLLALTFAQPKPDGSLHATPHYCLRQLGVIDQHAGRGGEQYRQFEKAIERLSQVKYRNDRFYDPIRKEHRRVSFGFLSYSLPLNPESSRAWHIAWDPIFYEIVRATGGSFRFDLATYRDLDAASRRLFLLLSKILSRRDSSPRFDVRHLTVNVLGFSSALAIRNLKVKLWRCVERMIDVQVIKAASKASAFSKVSPGEYSIVFQQGDYFKRRNKILLPAAVGDTAIHDGLRSLGFDDRGICRLMRQFSPTSIRLWTDVALAAKERDGGAYIKKSPQAYLVDSLKNAAKGKRTPPDWYHEQRRAERRVRSKVAVPAVPLGQIQDEDLSDESRQAYERIASEMFGIFSTSGQPEAAARENAEKFARDYVRRPDAVLDRPLFG